MRNEKPAGIRVRSVNRDVAAFVFFLFLSFGLWYINSLGRETEADFRYPFRYVNIPREREVTETVPPRLICSLKGPGYSLLKLRMSGDMPPVTIDLSKVSYKRQPEGRNNDYFIVTSALLKSLTMQIRTGCEVIAVKPDTLFFSISKSAVRPATDSRQ